MRQASANVSFSYSYSLIGNDITLWQLKGEPDRVSWAKLLSDGAQFLAQLERRGVRMALIVDPSELTAMDAGLRRAVALWRVENMALIANVVPCASYVAQNAWLRGAISTIFWIAPPIVPVGVKGSLEEALLWVQNELATPVARSRFR